MTADLLLLTGVEFQPQNGLYVVYTYMCKYLALCFHMHSSGLTDSNSQTLLGFRVEAGGTGVSGLTRFGDPSPKVDPGAFSGQRQGWKTPKQCITSVSEDTLTW